MNEHTVLDHLGNLGVALLAVLLFTSLHYLFLKHLNRGARLIDKLPQIRLVYILIFSLVAHSIEITLLAMAYKASITDPLFFTYSAFTTADLGDIVRTGPLRLLAGVEALTGFVLIAWAASYLYLEMTRMWRIQPRGFSRRRST